MFIATAFPYTLFAQKCPQANITATNYELRKQDGSPFLITDNYVAGQTLVNGKIFVKLGGSTTSGYNLTMVYDIYVNGTPQILRKQSCLFVASPIVQGVFVEVTDFSWIWGNKIEIRNIFITWDTGSPKANTTCPILTQTDIDGINSQCYFSGTGFTAVTPLYPRFTYSSACNSNVVSFTNNTSGGATPYTYSWNFGGLGTSTLKDPSFTFPQPGNYTVSLTVTDSQTPTPTVTTVSSSVNIPAPISINGTTSSTQLNGSTGSIDVTVTGGTAPYTFLWTYPNGSTRTTEDISSLPQGTYSFLVTDALGCTQTAQFIIYDLLTPNFTYTPTLCNSRIQFTDTTLGGTPPLNYTYSWDFDDDGISDSNLPNPIHEFAGSGNYPVKLTVTNGSSTVSVTRNIYIDPNLTIQVSIFPTKINESSGIIYVQSVTGGTPPYSYYWTGPNGFTSTNRDIFNLADGLYRLTVTDANGCTQTVEYVMDVASVLQLDWKSIDIKESGTKVSIQWEMNAEKEGSYYEIERSFKDVLGFSKIGEMPGKGTSQSPISYSFIDETFPVFEQLMYYRIVHHYAETSTYSPVKMVQREVEGRTESKWVAFPNPSRDGRIQLKYLGGNLSFGEQVQIQAINGGNYLKTIDLVIGTDGVLWLDQTLGSLPSGLTLLRIQWKDHSETIKVIRSD
ncbi:PKD domain-containing protein [Algoriphagus sp. AK58]|uniref:PKD domain-containing protein n=1 Tax=Algoriphagus sp. AK58 TaxID=1406877 RepID=UPI00164F5BB1|nr:PKD domain-containing protein [Algoriphagus sp. AK58]